MPRAHLVADGGGAGIAPRNEPGQIITPLQEHIRMRAIQEFRLAALQGKLHPDGDGFGREPPGPGAEVVNLDIFTG